MSTLTSSIPSASFEYMGAVQYNAVLPSDEDPFRHESASNSHNHHDLHPWGVNVPSHSKAFDALYAKANSQYMYHMWYTPDLAPFMATELLCMEPIPRDQQDNVMRTIAILLERGIDEALASTAGQRFAAFIQTVLDKAAISDQDQLFVRLGATSLKDSFALNVPTAKPDHLPPKASSIAKRLFTSGRSVGRLLALGDNIWSEDPGEVLVFERWSADIELRREFRVFCYKGKVTAVSQDIWWEKLGWRNEDLGGFVPAILSTWNVVKNMLPFDTCTMDVLMTRIGKGHWTAKIIEFNGFGAHLNTGSDLFHWVKDADILQGSDSSVRVRFVDDWEESGTIVASEILHPIVTDSVDDEPDWLALETKIRSCYDTSARAPTTEAKQPLSKTRLPLQGRWCSAY